MLSASPFTAPKATAIHPTFIPAVCTPTDTAPAALRASHPSQPTTTTLVADSPSATPPARALQRLQAASAVSAATSWIASDP